MATPLETHHAVMLSELLRGGKLKIVLAPKPYNTERTIGYAQKEFLNS